MLTNPPVSYDFCIGVPISCLLTVFSLFRHLFRLVYSVVRQHSLWLWNLRKGSLAALVSTVPGLIVKLSWPRSRSSLSALSWLVVVVVGPRAAILLSGHITSASTQHTTHHTPHIAMNISTHTHYSLQYTCICFVVEPPVRLVLVAVLPLCPVTASCKVYSRRNGQLQKWQNWNFMGNVKTKFLRVLAFSLKNPIWDKIHNWTNNAEPTSDPNSFLLLN